MLSTQTFDLLAPPPSRTQEPPPQAAPGAQRSQVFEHFAPLWASGTLATLIPSRAPRVPEGPRCHSWTVSLWGPLDKMHIYRGLCSLLVHSPSPVRMSASPGRDSLCSWLCSLCLHGSNPRSSMSQLFLLGRLIAFSKPQCVPQNGME